MAVHTDKLRWLLWMRWKLFTRGFTRERSIIIMTIVAVVLLGPLFIGVAVGTFFAYRYLPSPANEEILFLVLTAIYLLWIVLPIFEFNVNEGLDLSKLNLFPLTRLEMMLSLVFSTLLDLPMVGLILIFAAVIVGWAVSVPVALIAILSMLIFYVQVVGISQLVLALLARTLQSRRFRDLSIILIILFSSLCSIGSQFIGRLFSNRGSIDALTHATFSSYLQWLPPGMSARAIQQAVHGNYALSVAWLLGSLLISFVVLYIWQFIVERSLTAPEGAGGARTRRHRTAATEPVRLETQPVAANTWRSIFPPQLLAITGKEFKYYWRDPLLKALLFQSVATAVILLGIPLFNSFSSGFSNLNEFTWMVEYAPFVTLLAMLTFSLNSLGMERQSLTTLFLLPIAPQRILWGKNLAVFLLGLGEMIVLVPLAAFITHSWNVVLPAFVIGLAGMGIVLGAGNFTSVFFPQRQREMQRGFRATGSSSGNAGCIRALMSMTMLLITLVLLLPVAASLFVPQFFGAQWVWIITVPASLAYGIIFHQVVTRLVAPRILTKGPEILAITTRE